jgi:hypothetical protein
MTYYSDKDYGILHDHCQAIARERDHANRRIVELEAQNLHYFNQGNLWMSMMHDLADHLGNALYSDEWRTREYAIVAFNAYERANPEHEIDVDLRLDR